MALDNKKEQDFINEGIENIEKHIKDLTFECSIFILSFNTYKNYYEYLMAIKATGLDVKGINEFAQCLMNTQVIRYYEDEEVEYTNIQQALSDYIESLSSPGR